MKLAEIIKQTGEQEAVIQTLCWLLHADRTTVFLYKDFPEDVVQKTMKVINKYKKGTPLAYLLGSCYFYNRKFFVNKNVLVPRPDTEILVERAEKKIIYDMVSRKGKSSYRVLDLCCGSGAIGVSLACLCDWLAKKHKQHDFKVVLADISRDALSVAGANAMAQNVSVELVETDLFENVNGLFDLVVCNPPYVKTAEIGVEDKWTLKEPRIALDGGLDGLYFYRRILDDIDDILHPWGTIMFEIGESQADAVIQIAEDYGFHDITVHKDLANRDRVVTIRM